MIKMFPIGLYFIVSFFLWLVPLVHSVLQVGKTDYCGLKCPLTNSTDHTICKYKINPGPACGDAFEYHKLTWRDRHAILDIHNDLRGKVALGMGSKKYFFKKVYNETKASNMMMLKWDPELAFLAQRWANQCVIEHDVCRTIEEEQIIGQNIGYVQKYEKFRNILQNIIFNWYAQIFIIKEETSEMHMRPFDNAKLYYFAEYYQVLWATTHSIGCGRSVFKTKLLEDNKNLFSYNKEGTLPSSQMHSARGEFSKIKRRNSTKKREISRSEFLTEFLVCNYRPGMRPDSVPYKRGDTCSKCPPGSQCSQRFQGLCYIPDSAADSYGNLLWAGRIFVSIALALIISW